MQQEYLQLPTKTHKLYYNPQNPIPTLVLLKNHQHMTYFSQSPFHDILDNNTGQQIYKFFPNYYILNNIKISHRQKMVLHAMLNQGTQPKIMIGLFCDFAKMCYPCQGIDIQKLRRKFLREEVTVGDMLKWYTDQTFFYRLINRLLRAGKDSTELYYAQYFTKLLSKAIKIIYHHQKKKRKSEVAGNFKCFRAGFFSQKQISQLQINVGKHIQTLGFMSTSVKKSVAWDFLGNGNTFVEIDVYSDIPKHGELDLGYAYCEKYSKSPEQKEVLFNVLSSFQIKNVGTIEKSGQKIWHIQLEYGVTYQMVHQYSQNKASLERGTFQYQLILSILSKQEQFKQISQQDQCLKYQISQSQYIFMMETKIKLCRAHPQLEQIGKLFQYQLRVEFKHNQKSPTKNQPFPFPLPQPQQKNPWITLLGNLHLTQLQIYQNYTNGNYQQNTQLLKKWKQSLQTLCKQNDFRLVRVKSFQLDQWVKQKQTSLKFWQLLTQIRTHQNNPTNPANQQNLKKLLNTTKNLLQNNLLTKYGRYSPQYRLLNNAYMHYSYDSGMLKYEDYIRARQEDILWVKGQVEEGEGEGEGERIQMEMEMVEMLGLADRCIQCKQWNKAVKICTQFRNKKYPHKPQSDHLCFDPIIHYLANSISSTFSDKLSLLQASLNVKHPQNSRFAKQMREGLALYRSKQKQMQEALVRRYEEILGWEDARLCLCELQRLGQVSLPLFCEKDSVYFVVNQGLVVNQFRRLGEYQEAQARLLLLKEKVRVGGHPEYYKELSLDQFEQNINS